jgi:CDP-diacylglycerol--glycerol-3-phosphate 3-phosphatidyltransferase
MVLEYLGYNYWALAVYIIACLSDMADGYIARHYNQVSNFGKFMDPLADKVLVLAAMCIFIENGQMPAWAVVIVLFREFAVSGLRLIAVEQQRVIAAAWSGKIKTGCTMVGLCIMLFTANSVINLVVTWVIILTTVYSGVEYFYVNRDVFKNAD